MFNGGTNTCGMSYRTIIGLVILEFLLSSLILPYGIIYSQFVQMGITNGRGGLWTPITFFGIYYISSPWSRSICEYLDDTNRDYHRKIIAVSCLIFAASLAIGSLVCSNTLHVIIYGVFGGIFTNLSSQQLKIVTYEDFQNQPMHFDLFTQIGKAISLFVSPHLFVYLIKHFGIYNAQILLAAIILHVIPIALILKQKTFVVNKMTRYETLNGLFNKGLEELPADDEQTKTDETGPSYSILTNEPEPEPPSLVIEPQLEEPPKVIEEQVVAIPSAYLKNHLGVDVLPYIPEEEEEEEEEEEQKQVIRLSVKHLRKLSTQFEDLIKIDVEKSYLPVELNENNIDRTFHRINNKFSSLKRTKSYISRSCCSAHCKFVSKQRLNVIIEFFCEHFIRPLFMALRLPQFYSLLITKTVVTLVGVTFITVIPQISAKNERGHLLYLISESALMLTIISFSWLCFLIFTPKLVYASRTANKVLHVFGLALFSVSTSLLLNHLNEDMLTLSCLVFGLAYGSTNFTESVFYKEQIGASFWRKIEAPLEVLTGLFVILIYYILCTLEMNIVLVLSFSYPLLVAISLFWILNLLIKLFPCCSVYFCMCLWLFVR